MPQVEVISVQGCRRFAPRPLDLCRLELGRDRACHTEDHVVLQLEDFRQVAVEATGPEL